MQPICCTRCTLPQEVATDSKELWTIVREASRARAPPTRVCYASLLRESATRVCYACLPRRCRASTWVSSMPANAETRMARPDRSEAWTAQR